MLFILYLLEFIKEGNDYDTTAALGKLQEVEADLRTTKVVSVYEGTFIKFQDLFYMDRDDGETAALLKSKGLGSATSDGAIYKVMLGEKQLQMRMRDKWIPATVRLNITYNAHKEKPSPIGLAEASPHQGIGAATRFLELPAGAAAPKTSKKKSHPDEKRQGTEKKDKKD